MFNFSNIKQVIRTLLRKKLLTAINFPVSSFMAVDPSLFDMLDIEFLQRQKQSEQLIPGTALISDRMAKKYFGRTDVSGENIEFCISNEKQLMQIAGVFKQLPSYSSFHADFIYKS